jgi:hypothetical protein
LTNFLKNELYIDPSKESSWCIKVKLPSYQ